MELMDDYEEMEEDNGEEEYEDAEAGETFLTEPLFDNTKSGQLEIVVDESIPAQFCRICHETQGELIVPCRCNGTSKYVHPNCLREWRERFKYRQRGADSLEKCEICGFKFSIQLVEPNFLDYVSKHWTFFEKIMYSTSLFSCLFSIGFSLLAFWQNEGERIIKELESFEFVKRIPSRGDFFGKAQRDRIVWKKLPLKEYWEMIRKGRLAVFVAKTIPQVFLYGWPWNLKLFMTVCMITVCFGNSVIYKYWKRANVKEQVLPYSPLTDVPVIHSKDDRLD